MAICYGLENISSLHISNVVVESNCLEVVNLLNDALVDFSKVSFFIAEETSENDVLVDLSEITFFIAEAKDLANESNY